MSLKSEAMDSHWPLDPALTPHALVDLLSCTLCPVDDSLLNSPTTLACGHTLCGAHLPPAPGVVCPIPGCTPVDLSVKYANVHFAVTRPPPGSMDPIGSDVRLAQIISLALEGEQRAADFSNKLVELLTCEICLNLLEEPTTTRCQHTFCLSCIQRSLDHTPNCPLCRHHFPNIAIFNLYRPNAVLSSILLSIGPTDPRTTPVDPPSQTPIFVCQLSFPDMPTVLHIFEPRYRLMLRRALQSRHKQFGMIMYPAHDGLVINYGTMLRIQSIKILSDGRSVIETWGTHRFRIVNRSERDGYMEGEVERIDDLPEAMERELERNATLYIPPRTPPVVPFPSRSPRTSSSSHEFTSPAASLLPRPISPAPSIASLNSISTLSSTHSVPSSSAASTSASHSRRSSTRSYGLRRFRTGSSDNSNGSTSSGTMEAVPLPTTNPPTSPTTRRGHHPTIITIPPPPCVPGFDYPMEMTSDELVATCLAFIQRLRRGSSQIVIQRLNNVGPVPEDKALLSFWIAQLLPIDESEKSKLLPIRSPRLRLRLVVHWIDQFNAAWWFPGSGCVIA